MKSLMSSQLVQKSLQQLLENSYKKGAFQQQVSCSRGLKGFNLSPTSSITSPWLISIKLKKIRLTPMCHKQQPIPALVWSLDWLKMVKWQADGVIYTPFDIDSWTFFYPTKIYRLFSTDIFLQSIFPPDNFLPDKFLPARTYIYLDIFPPGHVSTKIFSFTI